MMKRKLLFSIVALLCSIGAWAVTAPTASTPTVGNSYYLYNPETKKFLAVNDNTPYVLDDGLEWILEDAGSSKIKIRLKNRTEGYFWGINWANFAGSYLSYTSEMPFILTDLGSNTYKLRTDRWNQENPAVESYVYINTDHSNRVACNSHAESSFSEELQKWQFVTESDYIAYKLQSGRSVDITSRIVNPSFEHGTNNFNGWINSDMKKQDNNSFEKTGKYYVESWEPNGTKSVKQTISDLPVGYYVLSADCKARSVTSAKIFAGSNEKSITIGDTKDTYSVMFYCDGSTNFNIGFEGVGTGASTSWLCVDNFILSYYKPYISEIAEGYPSGGSLAADKWYVYTIPMTGDYYFSATSGVVYTTNGTQVYDDASTTAAASKVSFTKDDKVYVKSTSAQTVKLEGKFYLSTTVGGVTKWLNKNASGYTYVYDRGLQFVLETSDYTKYQLKFSTGNYLNDVGSNWQTKAEGSHNNDWQLSSVEGGYKLLLDVNTACELFVKDTSTGLVEITHSTTDGNTWKFVTPDDYANYAALADINDKITAVGTLSYADPEKKPTVHNASSSSDAATYAASLTTALRAYVESNALGEGVSATDYTNKITNATCAGPKTDTDKAYSSADGWDLTYVRFDGGGGWTGSSTSHDVYFASNGYFWGNFEGSSNVSLRQVVSDLPTGKYLLTVRARSSGAIPTFYISGNGTQQNITHPNGVFGNNWDDTSVLFPVGNDGNATIQLKATKESDGTIGHWFSADNFQLVRIGDLDAVTISETATSAPTAAVADVTLTRTLSASYWNTFSVPFNTAIPSGWAVKEFDSAGGNVINFKDASTIEAGKPYLVKPTSNVENPTFNGVTVVSTSGSTDGEGDYQFAAQIYNKSLATDGTIAYLAPDASIKKLTSGGIKGLRAYFIIPSNAEARIAFIDEGVTEIQELKTSMTEELKAEQYYNLRGQRVEKPTKGLYIVNGKKVVK